MTQKNIRSGWSGSGLWPVNMAKPLMSPLVLDSTSIPTQITPKTPESWKKYAQKTPHNGKDIYKIIRSLPPSKRHDPVIRQLFAKVRKGLDTQITEIAEKNLHIRQLQQEVSKAKPIQRKKVEGDLNKRFIGIQDLFRVRATMRPDRQGGDNFRGLDLGPIQSHTFDFQADVNCM